MGRNPKYSAKELAELVKNNRKLNVNAAKVLVDQAVITNTVAQYQSVLRQFVNFLQELNGKRPPQVPPTTATKVQFLEYLVALQALGGGPKRRRAAPRCPAPRHSGRDLLRVLGWGQRRDEGG